MNKIATKFIYEQNGITTPPFSVFGKGHGEVTLESLARDHGFPCFAKCPQSGSSKLMGRAGSKQELADLLALLAQDSEEILVESAVSGIEFSCPVLEQPDGSASALLPVEIRPKTSAFFDYEAKYTDGGSEELVPAPRPQALIERVQQTALKAHTVLGCRGVTRTDIIASGEALYVLEINTLPGFTRNSLVPKSYKAGGGSYEELLELLIRAATRPLSAA
jgi:D-alanine-D-alanine ligase